MSANFLKVKRKMVEDMKAISHHDQQSWADIMLRAAKRCTSDADQKDFFRYIINPNDSWDVPEPTFMEIDSSADVLIPKMQRMTLQHEEEKSMDVELKQEVDTKGNTTFIKVTPIKCMS